MMAADRPEARVWPLSFRRLLPLLVSTATTSRMVLFRVPSGSVSPAQTLRMVFWLLAVP